MMWTVCEKWADFAFFAFVRPIGNKESKNQPRGDREKNCLECEMVNFRNVLGHLLSTFMIEVTNLNGFSIKHLRI
jgi:hypothetical protein